MSTSWEFVCVDHDPQLHSDDCGVNDRGLERMRELYAGREQLLAALDALDRLDLDIWDLGDHHERAVMRWFREHRTCGMKARNEYGEEVEL